MRRLFVACLTIALSTLGLAGSVFAQETSDVVILRFDINDVSQEVMDQFYSDLHQAVEAQSRWNVGPGGDVSIQDLLLVAGCASPTPDCLSMLEDFVEGDQLLFGSVQRSDDVHMFSIRLFDFRSGAIEAEVVDQTLRGDESWLAQGIPAVIEHFVHGKTASLLVEVSGHPETEIRVNGESAGVGSASFEGLSPGEVVVVAVSPDGQEQMDRAILRHGEQAHLAFVFEGDFPGPVEPAPAVSGRPSLLPGFAATAVGVGGLVVGILGHSRLTATESEVNTLVGSRDRLAENELSRAQELQDQLNSAHTMRVIGLSVGAVGLAAGGALLFRALSSGAAPDTEVVDRRGPALDVGFGATGDGVSAGIRFDF